MAAAKKPAPDLTNPLTGAEPNSFTKVTNRDLPAPRPGRTCLRRCRQPTRTDALGSRRGTGPRLSTRASSATAVLRA